MNQVYTQCKEKASSFFTERVDFFPQMKKNIEMEGIGEIFKRERKRRGLTIEAVALEADLSLATISRIENNEGFTSDSLCRVAKVLNFDMAMLFNQAAESSVYEKFLERMVMLFTLMRADPRASLIPALDGLIAIYARQMPPHAEVLDILDAVKRERHGESKNGKRRNGRIKNIDD